MPRDNRKLTLIYDKRSNDFVSRSPRECDCGLLLHHITDDIRLYSFDKEIKRQFPYQEFYNFKKDLESRGYDLETLRFEIKLKDSIIIDKPLKY